jgi:dipeptidyl aminopeptidase/acylaminoacyl peptidase
MTRLHLRLFTVLSFFSLATAAQDISTYQTPPDVIARLATAAPTPAVSFDSKGQYMLIMERSDMPSIEELAQPELRIAGMRINPANFTPSRQGGIHTISVKNIQTGAVTKVNGLPAKLRAGNFEWNPAEDRFAFTHTGASGVDLYVVQLSTKTAVKQNKTPLNLVMGDAISWLDNNTLLYRVTLKPASAAPPKPAAPSGPVIQQNLGKVAAARTFQDLIKSPHDEALFEFYATSQPVKNVQGAETKIGKPGIYARMQLSPDGKYVLVEKIQKPFSYLVPAGGFPSVVEITDLNINTVKELVKLPSAESTPTGFDNVQNVNRGYNWNSAQPATVVWIQPLDGGLIKQNVPHHDALYSLDAPFTGAAKELFRSTYRLQGMQATNGVYLWITEGLTSKQKQKVTLLDPVKNSSAILWERSTADAYNNPGTPVSIKNKFNRNVINIIDGNFMIMRGQGASPQGDFPFLSKYNIETKKAEKIWQCADKTYETVSAITNWNDMTVITSRQSQTDPPNFYLRNIGSGSEKKITDFPDPQIGLRGISKQKVKYKRKDGIDLAGDLYLPKGYTTADGPLPVVMWAYPREFKSASDAAQIRGSQYTYTRINYGSPVFWATQGYAVLDNAEMPIVGEGDKQPNDNFIEQLQWSAEAAIDKLSEMGVGDKNRVAVGGHSYGAFMTANLLAHTNLFKAGIARSGAYNRTLTPFGFQNEERTYWQAPEVYNRMSPFSHANKIKTPLLMIHGEADNNSGTFPIQSERLYNAVKGHGGTVRFVLLPYESHGYAAKENILHMLWEQHVWLEQYVKNYKGDKKKEEAVSKTNAQLGDMPSATDPKPAELNANGIPVTVKTEPVYIVNGNQVSDIKKIDPNTIESMKIIKDREAIDKYGEKGTNGVIEITLKKKK